MALIPRITPYDTKIIPQMYKDGYVLTAIYDNKIFWHRNENVEYQEEQLEKKAMYKKMEELKRDPVRWKQIEQDAFDLLTPTQQRSEAMRVHKDAKVREIISKL